MSTPVRTTTVRFSRRFDAYEPLDHQTTAHTGDDSPNYRRAFSKPRRTVQKRRVTTSFSFRRERAKERLIFLRTYKVAYSSRKSRPSRKLRKVVVKVKSLVVSVVSFLRLKPLRSCSSPSAIWASSPGHQY